MAEFDGYFKLIEFAVYCSPRDENNYEAFKKAFGDNSILYLKHFVEHGMREGRVASSNFDVNSLLCFPG